MSTYANMFNQVTVSQILTVFGIAFYLLEAFCGYRFIRVFISITGFFVGFILGFALSFQIYAKDAYVPAVVGILAGILIALIAYRLYILGVFILCGSIAVEAIGAIPFAADGSQNVLKIILSIAAFIIAGILAVKFAKFCVILITAIGGAINAVDLLKQPVAALNGNIPLYIAFVAVIAVLGFVVQKLTTKKR